MLSSVPQRTHDILWIATLNYYSILSISAVKEAPTWKSNRVFAMRYLKDMSTTRSRLRGNGPPDLRWLCCSSALINGSLCHVYLSPCTILALWAYVGKVPTKNLFISGIFTV